MMKLYSTGCELCNRLKRTLDEKKIEYIVENDIDLMISKGFTTVPMLEIDENNIMTFANAMKWALSYKGE